MYVHNTCCFIEFVYLRQYGWVLSLFCTLVVFFRLVTDAANGWREMLQDGRAMLQTCVLRRALKLVR